MIATNGSGPSFEQLTFHTLTWANTVTVNTAQDVK